MSTWSSDELAGLELSWPEFHERFPYRSRHAWRHKRESKAKTIKYKPIQPEVSDAELLEQTIAFGKVLTGAFPSVLDHDIEIKTDTPIAVAFPSDWHIGSEGCDLERIAEDVKLIAAHPRIYCSVGGDPIDNFILQKMMSASRSQVTSNIEVQWRLFRHLIKQLYDSDSLLWVSSGNHDAWTQQVAGIDGVLAALSGIDVCYTKEGGLVRLKVGNTTYRIYRKHKPVRWKSSYNPTHFLKMMLKHGTPWEWDVGIAEHLHEQEITTFEWRPGTQLDRIAICCGSYKVKDQYAEGIGYYGGGYGVPVVVFYPDRREMLPFSSLTHAIAALDGISPKAA